MEEGQVLAVGGLQAMGSAQLQGEGVVNDAINAVSTGHALTGAGHGRFILLTRHKRGGKNTLY